jgi:octaprenyl-diphosphate synthase
MMPAAPAAEPGIAPAGVFGRLAGHQAALDAFLREQLAEFEPEIRDLAAYSLEASGKRLRPALVFLSGWQGPGGPAPELVRVAAVVEMVHLATLVHDDIMDGADVRRNRPTVARRYGSAAAVLLGDALFAHALHLTTQFPTTAVCAAVSVAMRRVCAGEIVQTLRRGSLRVDRADYTRIVDLKTAELFRVSCQLGAEVAGHPADFVAAASRFGRHLGIGYQIYDDLVDFFGEEARIGKTLGTDLTSGKLTLPLLVLRERLDPAEQEQLAEELAGRREPDLPGRLEQMRRLGVFARVAGEVAVELADARAALAPWQSLAPSPRLSELADLLETQVRSLAPTA